MPVLNPIGYSDYVRDDPETAAIDDALNHSYALIEPNLPIENSSGGLNRFNKGEGEKRKICL